MQKYMFESPFEVKFVAETGVFEGYASVFNVTDSVRDCVLPGAFDKSLKKFRHEGRLPPLLWQHDQQQPIGALRDVLEDERGLFIKGELFVEDILRAREAHRLLREGVVTGLSIGYRAKKSYRDQNTGTRMLQEIDLLEISMVTFPALDSARVTALKTCLGQGGVPAEKEFEAFLREAGLSRKQAKGLMAHGYKSLLPREVVESDQDVLAIKALAEKLWRLAAT